MIFFRWHFWLFYVIFHLEVCCWFKTYIYLISMYDGVRRVSWLRREPVVSVENLTYTDPHIPLKKWTPTLSLKTPTLSLGVPCTENPHRSRNERVGVCHKRVGVLFFSGMQWGSLCGSSRRLQDPHVIPRPGVPRHMKKRIAQNQIFFNVLPKISVGWMGVNLSS